MMLDVSRVPTFMSESDFATQYERFYGRSLPVGWSGLIDLSTHVFVPEIGVLVNASWLSRVWISNFAQVVDALCPDTGVLLSQFVARTEHFCFGRRFPSDWRNQLDCSLTHRLVRLGADLIIVRRSSGVDVRSHLVDNVRTFASFSQLRALLSAVHCDSVPVKRLRKLVKQASPFLSCHGDVVFWRDWVVDESNFAAVAAALVSSHLCVAEFTSALSAVGVSPLRDDWRALVNASGTHFCVRDGSAIVSLDWLGSLSSASALEWDDVVDGIVLFHLRAAGLFQYGRCSRRSWLDSHDLFRAFSPMPTWTCPSDGERRLRAVRVALTLWRLPVARLRALLGCRSPVFSAWALADQVFAMDGAPMCSCLECQGDVRFECIQEREFVDASTVL